MKKKLKHLISVFLMSLLFLTLNSGSTYITFFSLFLFSAEASNNMENGSIDYDHLKEALVNHHKENKSLLNSSKDKDIVVFLGATNSGKSTLINYLCGKELEVLRRKIILSESSKSDPSSMEIGTGGESKTLLPKSIPCGDLLFYDFPGLEDTRGLVINLLNAGFIKNIVENAKTIRLVFVAGEKELDVKKGESLKNIISIASNLMGETSINGLSSLVITKSRFKTIGALQEEIINMCGEHEMLNEWISNGRVSQMSFPKKQKIKEEERDIILESIKRSIPEKIEKINMGCLLNNNYRDNVRKIYNQAINKHKKRAREKAMHFIKHLLDDDTNILERNVLNLEKLYQKKIFRKDQVVNFLRNINKLDYSFAKAYLKYQYNLEFEKISKKENKELIGELLIEELNKFSTNQEQEQKSSINPFKYVSSWINGNNKNTYLENEEID